MKYTVREYPMFSACGLNCGLCPRYQMSGASKCPGCGEGFLRKHPTCGALSCTQRKGLQYCHQCAEYPCKKYDKSGEFDSFITHLNQFRDIDRAKNQGMDAYAAELNRKIAALEKLLADYDDGRRKNTFCLAVNLFDLRDVEFVLQQIVADTLPDMPIKEKAALAAARIQAMAEKRDITLKLRKPVK